MNEQPKFYKDKLSSYKLEYDKILEKLSTEEKEEAQLHAGELLNRAINLASQAEKDLGSSHRVTMRIDALVNRLMKIAAYRL
jgi:hypothetical protein